MDNYLLREETLDPLRTKHYEGAFAQGSGYLHIRGSFEEGLQAAPQGETYMRLPANVTLEKPRHPRSKCGVYVPGITGAHPLLKMELVNLPNPLRFDVEAEGARLDMDDCDIAEYRRALDMRSGELSREFIWRVDQTAALACEYVRFVSMARKDLIVQRMRYRAIGRALTIAWRSETDADVRTNGYDHFASVRKWDAGDCAHTEVVTDTGDRVLMTSRLICPQLVFVPQEGFWAARGTLAPGEDIIIKKYTVVETSRDQDAATDILALPGFDALRAESRACWEALWRQAEIHIEGDDAAQRAVNFSMYHLMRAASQTDDRIAVCAKGYAGEAYFGHFFWDTEMYLLPFFLYNFPRTAECLAGFRIRTLDGAMENAKAYGYPGARYPWESSVSGLEQCPNWQYGDHEVHVTADVVFGLWHTYRATGDEAFLRRAVPVFVETARYWLERAYREADGSYSIRGVMGPDEYICLCDNNAYTNYLVRYALDRTLEAVELVRATGGALPDVDDGFLTAATALRDGLRFSIGGDGVVPQCDGFADLEEPDFEHRWPDRSRPYGTFVSQERNYRTKALKQADALMLPYLFPDAFTPEQVDANLAYYLPYTTHDSSLSAIIHAILFARRGKKAEAYDFFRRALNIDLDGGAAEGIHIANCGGIWQGIVMGFAGMLPAYASDTPEFTPHLPAHWRSLSFRVAYRGARYQVLIRDGCAQVTRLDEKDAEGDAI